MEGYNKGNNQVRVVGIMKDSCQKSHTLHDEVFYSARVLVERLSGMIDEIPITLSEKLNAGMNLKADDCVEAIGQFRSYNRYIEGRNKLVLTMYVKEIHKVEGGVNFQNNNRIQLQGYICKAPSYRTTPFGREIADVLIAVNRMYNKSDYIPCICWGGNARYASGLKVGDFIKLSGRIQSRNYQKKQQDSIVEKTAFEISVADIKKIIN